MPVPLYPVEIDIESMEGRDVSVFAIQAEVSDQIASPETYILTDARGAPLRTREEYNRIEGVVVWRLVVWFFISSAVLFGTDPIAPGRPRSHTN